MMFIIGVNASRRNVALQIINTYLKMNEILNHKHALINDQHNCPDDLLRRGEGGGVGTKLVRSQPEGALYSQWGQDSTKSTTVLE